MLMDKPTGLEYLPYDVIEHIAKYLSVKDLLACCATCSMMRHTFSCDLVWKHKCNLELVDYLQSTEPVVEPNFDWSEVMADELSTLSPLPAWRTSYMKQILLFRNWREGRYEKEELEILSDDIYFSCVRFYQNDTIFYRAKNYKRIEHNAIWNVKYRPILHSKFNLNLKEFLNTETMFSLGNMDYSKFEIVDNNLVVSFNNLVLIYDITLNTSSSIKFSQAFLFDLPEEESNSLCRTEPRTSNISLPITVHFTKKFICSNYFIGTVKYTRLIHIWDIQSGKKVAEEIFPENCEDEISFLSPVVQTNHFLMKFTTVRDVFRNHYYGYDLKTIKFSSFIVKLNDCEIEVVSDKFVIGASSNMLFSYSYETSEKLAERKCNDHIYIHYINVVNSRLLCLTNDDTTFIMDPYSLNIIYSGKGYFDSCSLTSICNRFVFTYKFSTTVWEIDETIKQIFKLEGYVAAINQTCTKIALVRNNKIIILNFW